MRSNKYRFLPDPQTGYISDENARAYFSRVGIAVFVLGIASTLASTALYMLLAYALPAALLKNAALTTALNHLISVISIYGVGAVLLCYVLKPLPTIRPFKEKMAIKDIFGGFCIGLLLMMAGNYVSNVILTWVMSMAGSIPTNPVSDSIAPSDPWVTVVTVIFMVIVAPILEEIVFRKVLCDKLLPLGEGYAIVLSAAVFGLIHGNLYQFAYAFLLGALFSLIYIKTGRLIYSIGYHMLINLFGSVIGPWILERIDLDRLYEIVESGIVDMSDPIWQSMYYLLAYEAFMTVGAVIGLVLIFKERKRRRLSLERGILPPPKKGRFANLFLNAGVAAAIAYFAVIFVISLA